MPALTFQNHLDNCENQIYISIFLRKVKKKKKKKNLISIISLRVEKMLKEPRTKNCHRGFRQASDGSPNLALALDHTKLLKRHSTLSTVSVKQA